MIDVKEQQICIKFHFKLGKMASNKMLKVYGDNALGQTQTYEWFKRFKNRGMLVDDDEHF